MICFQYLFIQLKKISLVDDYFLGIFDIFTKYMWCKIAWIAFVMYFAFF